MKRYKNVKTIVTGLSRRKQTNCRETDYILITGE